MHILVTGEYLPSPPSGATAWTMRGEKTWTDAVSDVGAKAIASIPGVKQARLWGTDVYTDDSDLLAVLFHSSWLRPITSAWLPERDANGDIVEPVKRVKRTQDDLRVIIRVAPKLVRYVASERASFVSRGWGNSHDGVSYVIEKVDRALVSCDCIDIAFQCSCTANRSPCPVCNRNLHLSGTLVGMPKSVWLPISFNVNSSSGIYATARVHLHGLPRAFRGWRMIWNSMTE